GEGEGTTDGTDGGRMGEGEAGRGRGRVARPGDPSMFDPDDAWPDLAAVERLVEDAAAGWIDVVHHSPEQGLDVWLADCVMPTDRVVAPIPPHILQVNSIHFS